MFNRQQKSMINALTYQNQTATAMAQQKLQQSCLGDYAGVTDINSLDENQQKAFNAAYGLYNQKFAEAKASADMYLAFQKQSIEDIFENLKETQLEPLKDEEEELQSEKDSLESRIQIAKQDYDACKTMEQDGTKMLKPDFTGNGQ